jgi:hypothetical protein
MTTNGDKDPQAIIPTVGQRSGIEEMLAVANQVQGNDLAQTLITGSDDANEIYGRTRLTDRDLKRKRRIAIGRASMLRGGALYSKQEWMDLNGRLSIDGASRREAITVATERPTLRPGSIFNRMSDATTPTSNERGPNR